MGETQAMDSGFAGRIGSCSNRHITIFSPFLRTICQLFPPYELYSLASGTIPLDALVNSGISSKLSSVRRLEQASNAAGRRVSLVDGQKRALGAVFTGGNYVHHVFTPAHDTPYNIDNRHHYQFAYARVEAMGSPFCIRPHSSSTTDSLCSFASVVIILCRM